MQFMGKRIALKYKTFYKYDDIVKNGEVSEWLKVAVSKTAAQFGCAEGSNPSLSAKLIRPN